MTYPTKAEISMSILTGGFAGAARKFGLTITEAAEINAHGKVSAATQAWADDLRARCPKAFEAAHVA